MNVVTNGCFDLLGYHHCDFLQRCSLLGDRLIVAVNSDASVKRLKGPSRPIYSQADRLGMVASIKGVDEVRIFDTEQELEDMIRQLRPVLVKGSDYAGKTITGSQYASQVILLPILPGYSTTATLAKL